MSYFNKKDYQLIGFEKSNRKNKMYNAILLSKNNTIKKLPFGDNRYENFRDITGLNLYPQLIHSDKKRRNNYRKRHQSYLKEGFYSPGYFSFHYLW